MLRYMAIGSVITLLVVSGFTWLPNFIPDAHWPSFWGGAAFAVVTVIAGFYGWMYLATNRRGY